MLSLLHCQPFLSCAEVFQGCTPDQVTTALTGRQVKSVSRKGKYFWYELDGDGPDILFHFGMTGYLAIKGHDSASYVRIKKDGEWPPRFIKLELGFDDGTTMGFVDARRCALLMGVCHSAALHFPVTNLRVKAVPCCGQQTDRRAHAISVIRLNYSAVKEYVYQHCAGRHPCA
jgi:formamidopyrimidine-DNA glycosylase